MLISFSVVNFKSIKDKQTLHLTPIPKYHSKLNKKLKNNIFKTGLEIEPQLLKTTAIYGANASGKSNIIEAISVFRYVFAREENRKRGNPIGFYKPFAFSKETVDKPCEFEIDFIASNNIRYVYSFTFNSKRICFEKLDYYRDSKQENIYQITIDDKDQFNKDFSKNFKGEKSKASSILENTKNNLFLPSNVNEDGNQFLNPVYDWILNKLLIANTHKYSDKTLTLINKSQKDNDNILSLIKKADFGISDFTIKEKELTEKEFEKFPKSIRDHLEGIPISKIRIDPEIKMKHNNYFLDFKEESDGTKALFNLAGMILPILKDGGILFFDELDRSLHPDLLIYIIELFHNPEINQGNAQLVFTVHDDILLDQSIFRRDQIWFTVKTKKEQQTDLYSLAEFEDVKPRDNIAKKYRNGDFGARPALQEFYWK